MTAIEALLLVSGAHAGFQAVVSGVVYPALVELRSEDWAAGHASHSRRISWVVAPVYLGVAVVCLWVLLAGPRTVATAVCLAGHAVAAGSTALVAAPTHGRLGDLGKQPALVRRLLLADRVRLGAALVAFVASGVAASSTLDA